MPAENSSQSLPGKVAIYWDFENFHAVMADKTHGAGSYRGNSFVPQPVFFELAPVLEYAASFGDIIINKAYGNWQWFANYRHLLNIAGVDLIQMFPRGKNMKNSADIRLALDTISDIYAHPHITHVVVVSSDSDFISLAQKIKQAGKFVAGVGVNGFSNKFWVASCNEFKFFESLRPVTEAPVIPPSKPSETPDAQRSAAECLPTMEEARRVLQRAMLQLVERNGENYVAKSGLKSIIMRLMPSFDERALNCGNFSGFLHQCRDMIVLVDDLSGGHVALLHYEPTTVELPDQTELLPSSNPLEASEPVVAPDWPVPTACPEDSPGETASPDGVR